MSLSWSSWSTYLCSWRKEVGQGVCVWWRERSWIYMPLLPHLWVVAIANNPTPGFSTSPALTRKREIFMSKDTITVLSYFLFVGLQSFTLLDHRACIYRCLPDISKNQVQVPASFPSPSYTHPEPTLKKPLSPVGGEFFQAHFKYQTTKNLHLQVEVVTGVRQPSSFLGSYSA